MIHIMDRVTIIAEAGVNHNGDIDLAKKLIDVASEAGADYVKFQTFKADKLVSAKAKKAEYQKKNHPEQSEDSQLAMLKKLELTEEQHRELFQYCQKKNIKFLSTAFDEESLDFLFHLGIDFFKIPSGEITNLPYLEKIATYGKPVVLSTGMADMNEIEEALSILEKCGLNKDQITVLHCHTEYPTPMEHVHLLAMKEIQKNIGTKVGYSDHTLGIEVPIAAVALGASCIEKHFTLSRNLEGPDHKASLEPDELAQMIKSIRNVEVALGNPIKKASAMEEMNKEIARKSIHVACNIRKGQTILKEHLIMKRPGIGISPMKLYDVIGKKATKDLVPDELLSWKDIE